MKKPKFRLSARSAAAFLALSAGMVLLNFALSQREPLAFALYYAALVAGAEPFSLSAAYLAASAASLSLFASLSAAIQSALMLLVSALYRRLGRRAGLERALYALIAQVPFVFLFPHTGYPLFALSPILWKVLLGALIFVLCIVFEGGMSAIGCASGYDRTTREKRSRQRIAPPTPLGSPFASFDRYAKRRPTLFIISVLCSIMECA